MQDIIYKTLALSRSISTKLAYFSGLLFLLLSIYMSADVASRSLGGPFTGVADTFASFTLALGGTWAMARALADGSHVRIDVLMPLYNDRIKSIFYIWSMAMAAIFACVLAKQAWVLTLKSASRNALVPQSMVDIPLAVPQGLSAVGYSLFAVQAIIMMIAAIAMMCAGRGDLQETLETHELGENA